MTSLVAWRGLSAVTLAFGIFGQAAAQTEIELWHALSGATGDQLTQLVERFNGSQPAYRLVPVFKGGQEETVKAGLQAQRAGRAPHILQVDDALTESVLSTRTAFRPVFQVMQEAREPLDAGSFLKAVSERFSDNRGRLYSVPLNTATPVLFYNKDAFAQAGLDPEDPPRTWLKVQEAALKLVDHEHGSVYCGYTTDWPAWIHIENLLAWHDEPLSERSQAPRGAREKLILNARLMMRHIGLLSSWVKSGIFTYYGRRSEGESKFAEGECGILTASSSSYAEIVEKAQFNLGVSPLPFHDDFPGAPFSTLVGGGSLWVMAGKKSAEYKGVAKFLAYLSRPEVQAQWHQATGFLPATAAAFELGSRHGFYTRNPGIDVPVRQVHGSTLHLRAKRTRGHHASWLRAIADEELEAVWQGRKTPKQALDDVVERGNRLLQLTASRRDRPAASR
jgi:sn-glycerol 3-phosphate transport system substrate-binding protein